MLTSAKLLQQLPQTAQTQRSRTQDLRRPAHPLDQTKVPPTADKQRESGSDDTPRADFAESLRKKRQEHSETEQTPNRKSAKAPADTASDVEFVSQPDQQQAKVADQNEQADTKIEASDGKDDAEKDDSKSDINADPLAASQQSVTPENLGTAANPQLLPVRQHVSEEDNQSPSDADSLKADAEGIVQSDESASRTQTTDPARLSVKPLSPQTDKVDVARLQPQLQPASKPAKLEQPVDTSPAKPIRSATDLEDVKLAHAAAASDKTKGAEDARSKEPTGSQSVSVASKEVTKRQSIDLKNSATVDDFKAKSAWAIGAESSSVPVAAQRESNGSYDSTLKSSERQELKAEASALPVHGSPSASSEEASVVPVRAPQAQVAAASPLPQIPQQNAAGAGSTQRVELAAIVSENQTRAVVLPTGEVAPREALPDSDGRPAREPISTSITGTPRVSIESSARTLPVDAAAGASERTTAARAQADSQLERAFAAQLERGVLAALNSPTSVVTLRLHPAALGQVRIQVAIDRANVSAKFEASSSRAKDAISRGVDGLKAALADRGLELTDIAVSVAAPFPERNFSLPSLPVPERPVVEAGGLTGIHRDFPKPSGTPFAEAPPRDSDLGDGGAVALSTGASPTTGDARPLLWNVGSAARVNTFA